MGRVGRFERRLQGMVGDASARVFGGSVVPQEITGALKREAEDQVQELAGGRLLAPNRFTVMLSPHDLDRIAGDDVARVVNDLSNAVARHLTDQGLDTFGEVVVFLERSEALHTGQFRTRSVVDPDASRRDAVRARNAGEAPMSQQPGHPEENGHYGYDRGNPGYGQQTYAPQGYDQRRVVVTTRASPRATASRATRSRATASRVSRRPARPARLRPGLPPAGLRPAAGLRPGAASPATAASRATTRATPSRDTAAATPEASRPTRSPATASPVTTRARLRPAGRLPAALRPGLRRRVRPAPAGLRPAARLRPAAGRLGRLPAAAHGHDRPGRRLRPQLPADRGHPRHRPRAGLRLPAARHRRVASPPGDQLGRSPRDADRPRVDQRHHGERQPDPAAVAAQRRRRDPGGALQPGVPYPVSRTVRVGWPREEFAATCRSWCCS